MSNIHHLRRELLPNMLQRFEALYGLKSVDDKKVLANIIEQVDDVLFQDYLKRKREMFQSITAAGLLSPTADPLTNVRPKGRYPATLSASSPRVLTSQPGHPRCASIHAQRSIVPGGCARTCHESCACIDATGDRNASW
jgi:hypothetical protein